MKQISSALSAHIAGEVTQLATCWKMTRRDAVVFGFTDFDKDITFESVLYKAASGFTPSAVASSASLSVDNMEVEGMISSGNITEADILAGKYDFAAIEIFLLNTADISMGALKLRRGWLGEISLHKQQFVAEVRGLAQRLSQTIGDLYSPSCRAALGDAKCKVSLPAHTVNGTVTQLVSSLTFRDSARSEASAIFSGGKVTFTSGANQGISMEVKEYQRIGTAYGEISLVLPLPFPLSVGDSYQIIKGCDKTTATCFSRFNNIVNFRGEPHVPGFDRILETAGTRSNW